MRETYERDKEMRGTERQRQVRHTGYRRKGREAEGMAYGIRADRSVHTRYMKAGEKA